MQNVKGWVNLRVTEGEIVSHSKDMPKRENKKEIDIEREREREIKWKQA